MSSAEMVAELHAPVAPMPRVRYHGVFLRQFVSETSIIFRRKRNIAILAVLGAVPVLIGVAVKISAPRGGGGPAFIGQITSNGLFLAFAALTLCLPVFLPVAVAVVAGDAVAGEANTGTLRYLLTVPVSRTRLLLVKTAGVIAFIIAGIALVTVIGIVLGVSLFGTHGMTLLSGDTVSVEQRVAALARGRGVRVRRPARARRDRAVLLDADGGAGRRDGRNGRARHRLHGARRGAAAGRHSAASCSRTTGSTSRPCCDRRSIRASFCTAC